MTKPGHNPHPSADDQAVRAVLKKVHSALDQNPDAFRGASGGRLGLWLWRIAVVLLLLGCLAVWLIIPALDA